MVAVRFGGPETDTGLPKMATVDRTGQAALSNGDLLRVWEIGQSQSPIERALTILAVAFSDESVEEHACLSIGQRDARLFDVREATFGTNLACLVPCPDCGDAVELALDASDIGGVWADAPSGSREGQMAIDAWEIAFRPPDSRDLTAAVAAGNPVAARERLVARCVRRVLRDGREWPVSALDASAIAGLAAGMAAYDPGSEIELAVTCPVCGACWRTLFDVGTYLWIEIDARAKRLLREIATLARAYGWREADILALSAVRRHAYLELC